MTRILKEVIQKFLTGTKGGCFKQLIHLGYYLLIMEVDAASFARRYEACQPNSNSYHAL